MLLLLSAFLAVLPAIISGSDYDEGLFSIPEPEIKAYYPKGFEISIPHEDGIVLFAFHANVNKEMRYLEAGQISHDITRKINNRWTYKDRNLRLKLGDVIYYWLFVIRDGLGYRRDDVQYVVTELQRKPSSSDDPPTPRPRPTTTETPELALCTTEPPRPTSTEAFDHSAHLVICERTLINATRTLIKMTADFDELRARNDLMKEIIEKDPDGRKLKLTGRLPTEGEPEDIVKFVLNEKFSLKPKILTAYQGKDSSITFEVKLEDKLAIIQQQAKLGGAVNSVSVTY